MGSKTDNYNLQINNLSSMDTMESTQWDYDKPVGHNGTQIQNEHRHTLEKIKKFIKTI